MENVLVDNNKGGESQTYKEYLKNVKGLSDYTIYHYTGYEKLFDRFDFLGTQESINQFIFKHKNHSVVRGFMRSYLEYANLQETFKLPPKQTGTKPKAIIKDIDLMQIEILKRAFYKVSDFHGTLFEVIYTGALRRSEVKNIKIDDFNWIRFFRELEEGKTPMCELRLREAKGKKDRVVLIPPEVISKILKFLEKRRVISLEMESIKIATILSQRGSYLFLKPSGKRMDGWTIWRIITSISERSLGIEIRPHELRHARATELEEKGLSTRAIQHYLGHSSVGTTETYLHTSTKKSLEQVKKAME